MDKQTLTRHRTFAARNPRSEISDFVAHIDAQDEEIRKLRAALETIRSRAAFVLSGAGDTLDSTTADADGRVRREG